jgi:hypothetical protein
VEKKTVDAYAPDGQPEHPALIAWLKGHDPQFRRVSRMQMIGDGNRRAHDGVGVLPHYLRVSELGVHGEFTNFDRGRENGF